LLNGIHVKKESEIPGLEQIVTKKSKPQPKGNKEEDKAKVSGSTTASN